LPQACALEFFWRPGETLEGWNGRGWTSLPSPSLNHAVNVLWAVSAPTATDIWAAGGGYKTLIMHICPPAGG
jgi:hypothetical protein